MKRDMYEAGTVCRTAVTLGTAKGETFTWHEPARFLFCKERRTEDGRQREYWYETLSDPLNVERFYTLEPLDAWY